MYFCPLVSLKCCEQKRLTRKMRITFVPPSKCSATVEVMVDFPDPASLVNQKIRRLLDILGPLVYGVEYYGNMCA